MDSGRDLGIEGGAARRRSSTLLVIGIAALGLLAALGAGSRARPSLESVCADPSDCRLWEAASLSGVRFGFHDQGGGRGPEREIAAAEGNAYTNHGLSWAAFQPTPVGVSSSMDAACAFSRDRGLFQVGFHFAWEQVLLDDIADWVLAIDDPAELRQVLRERARLLFDRCPGLDRVSVVNEPLVLLSGVDLSTNHFYRVLGPDYIGELFQIVRDEAPDHVELFLNDYGLIYFPERAEAYVELARQLVESGAPIDAVGLQTHLFFLTFEPDFAAYRKTLEELAALGLKVFVSELDVPVPPELPDRLAVQADLYRKVVEACLAVPACDTVVVWGIDDGNTWLDGFDLVGPGHDPLLFDAALARKPAYFAVREALLRGRGGDHPVSGDSLRIRRKGKKSRLEASSRDPGVVSPTPNSTNDPRAKDSDGGTVELIRSNGRVERFRLPAGRGWEIQPGKATFSGESENGVRAWLRLREGKGFDLELRDAGITPRRAAQGLRVRVSIGSLRVCTDFGSGRIPRSDRLRLKVVGAPRAAGYDCSDAEPPGLFRPTR